MSEEQVLELVWRTVKSPDRPKDRSLLTRETGVDQRQLAVALDQKGVCKPHRDDVHTFDHTLHSHTRNPQAVFTLEKFTSVWTGGMLLARGRRLVLLFDRAELREQGEKIS